MAVFIVKPIPLAESTPSRISAARGMWIRNYALTLENLCFARGQPIERATKTAETFKQHPVQQQHVPSCRDSPRAARMAWVAYHF